MLVDGPRIRRFRESLGMTQEVLASKAKISIRTVQRAEAGADLELESVADLAAVLGKQPIELRASDGPADVDGEGDANVVMLHRTQSARDILDLLASCWHAEISCDVEPTSANADALANIAELLHSLSPEPYPQSGPGPSMDFSQGSPLAARIRTTARLNDELDALRKIGVLLFAGSYVKSERLMTWNDYEYYWGYSNDDEETEITVGVVRISSRSADKIRLPLLLRRNAEPAAHDVEDEIPFGARM